MSQRLSSRMPPVFEDHLFGSKVILIADRKETVESGSLCKNKPLTEDLRSISHTAAAIQQGFRPLEFEAVHSCQLACFAAEAEALSHEPFRENRPGVPVLHLFQPTVVIPPVPAADAAAAACEKSLVKP